MNISTRHAAQLALAGCVWPCVLFLVCLNTTGPAATGGLEQAVASRPTLASPPVDTAPQRFMLESTQVSAKAEVFWQEPTKARIKWQIEIKPEQPR